MPVLKPAMRFLAITNAPAALTRPADATVAAVDAAVVAFSLPTVAAEDATWKACDVLTFSRPSVAATVALWYV